MIVKCSVKTLDIIDWWQINYSGKTRRERFWTQANTRTLTLPDAAVSDGRLARGSSNRPSQDSQPQEGPRPTVQSVIIWRCQRLDLLSGLGTHFVMAAFHSTGASRRLSVVTLRIRRYTCNRSMGTVTGVPEGKACSPHVSLSTGRSVVSESTLNSSWSHWAAELTRLYRKRK